MKFQVDKEVDEKKSALETGYGEANPVIRTQLSLLDAMAEIMHCDYLSDLQFLTQNRKTQLAILLRQFSATDDTLWEWNQALQYLMQAPPEKDAYAAKQRLIWLLSQQNTF